jgi:adenosylcobinamide-GDP ribazoletransferase
MATAGLGKALRAMVLAVQYFTRVPLPTALLRWSGFDAALQRASFAHFPGVGLLVGAAAATAYAAACLLLPRSPFSFLAAGVLSTVVTMLLTGALHEDGLADTGDALGAGGDRERMLLVMKDPRVGSYGVCALVIVLLGKVSLLALLGDAAGWERAAAALLAAHVLSRGLSIAITAGLSHVGTANSKSSAVAGPLGGADWVVALAWCILGAVAAAPSLPLPILLAGLAMAGGAWLWMRAWLARRLQGFTGDCLGATQQLCELAFYLGTCLALGGAVA